MGKVVTRLVVVWLALFIASPVVSAEAESGEAPGFGTLILSGGSDRESRATRLESDVDIRVNGLVGRVNVTQRFRNTGDDWREGRYVFPLPEDAAVDRLRVTIGDRVIEGEIQAKEQAKETYEKAKASGKKASLVSQDRPNLFTTSVANIGPGQTVEVHIRYRERLSYEDERFSLRFPMTLTPRFTGGPHQPERTDTRDDVTPPMQSRDGEPTNPIDLDVDLNAGLDLAEVTSPSHTVETKQRGAGRYRVRPVDGVVPSDRDFVLHWRPEPSAAPRASAFTETVDGQRYAQIMVMPPSAERTETLPRELIFVIDTSGSMSGSSIRQARRALADAIGRLGPRDRFNVVEFDNQAERWYREPRQASEAQRDDARRRAERLNAGGGTQIHRALSKSLDGGAARERLRQVVVITDGAVSNEDRLLSQIHRDLGGSRLFTIGIGAAPNSYFMSEAAEAGRGSTTTIGNRESVAERMGELFRKLEGAMARDIRVDWPAGTQAYPDPIPDLYAGEPVALSARLPAGDHRITVTGRTGERDWEHTLALGEADEAEGVSVIWARARVESLMDELQKGADEAEIRPAVIATAKRHRLVTRYTSLVAVAKERSRPKGESLKRDDVPNNMPAGNTMGQSGDSAAMPQTATPAMRSLLIGMTLVVMALSLAGWAARSRGPAS
jgi:Ca-activated chloride channel family protein